MIATILYYLAMPVVRWIGIGLIGFAFTVFMRVDAAAPHKQRVQELETAIVMRDQIINAHNQMAEMDRVEAEKLDKEVEALSHAAKPDDCRLSAADLARLRKLAGVN